MLCYCSFGWLLSRRFAACTGPVRAPLQHASTRWRRVCWEAYRRAKALRGPDATNARQSTKFNPTLLASVLQLVILAHTSCSHDAGVLSGGILGLYSVDWSAGWRCGPVRGPDHGAGCRVAVRGRIDEHEHPETTGSQKRYSPVSRDGPSAAHARAPRPSHGCAPRRQPSLRPQHLMPTVCGTSPTTRCRTRR